MRFRPRWVGLVLVGLTAACGGKGGGGGSGGGGDGGRTEPLGSGDTVTQRPLTAQQREVFYHLAEGSEILPYAWIRALRDPNDRSKFFLQDPERFGLIADPANRDSLPVGVTVAETVDTRFLGIRMLGFNCSACHVNEITYQGSSVRVDGGPSRFNTERFGTDLTTAMKQTLQPLHLLQFIHDLVRNGEANAGHPDVPLNHSKHPAVRQMLEGLVDAERTAAEELFLGRLHHALRADSARNPAMNLHYLPFDSAAPGFQQLQQRYAQERLNAAHADLRQALPPHPAVAADAQATTARHGSLSEMLVIARMLRDRIEFMTSIVEGTPKVRSTPDGPGRVDAFGVARNRLYPQRAVPTTAPVSFPHLWGFGQNRWLHYDANTTSVMERNLGQALGVGGVFDPVTLRSTLNPIHLHRLELLARQIPEPAWPSFFPPIDRAKAARGEPLYGRLCAGCHQDPPARDVCYPLNEIRTDPVRAVNFMAPLGNGRFTDSVGPVLRKMKYAAYEQFNVPRNQWDTLNEIPDDQVFWRTTGQYGIRTLRGAWATAPYLHNGSVPSLYELLLPASRRSRTFPLGHAEYDPVRVGYTMNAPAGTPTFDTSIEGNSNAGHEFGADLSDEERWALVEYLKTLGAYTGTRPQQSGGSPCPNLNGPIQR